MLLSQICVEDGTLHVVARDGTEAYLVRNCDSVHALAMDCARLGVGIKERVGVLGLGPAMDLEEALAAGRFRSPIHHPDPAHLHLTGTGLTHLGSAATRDSMHQQDPNTMTDSMKMFRMGVEGGKPSGGRPGVQPEWFYKGTGHAMVAPGGDLVSPGFAEDGGEEPEIAGIYVIGMDGTPFRVGFALANEFSDHVMEKENYLYLAHSKLRPASFGPELLVGELPRDIRGTSRIWRGRKVVFEKPFLSGEDNMSHSVANLEYHHFKYDVFRQPGDVHVHMFGTATLSFADGVRTKPGDQFEIEAPEFGLPLRNRLQTASAPTVDAARVRAL